MNDYTERQELINQLDAMGMGHVDWNDLETEQLRETLARIKARRQRGIGRRLEPQE